ncbi:MAG: hypothetical protein BGO70_07115 [Bacteroidetes bacterium 43-93]|nr:hypothetical protein [Bacteroidota bacterium]OJW97550.1 MAG: hypothetical protein BGO70_07115 [Bacteroidetes bacterium 43-93]
MRSVFTLIALLLSIAVNAQSFSRFDLNPGPQDSGPSFFTLAANKMFFVAGARIDSTSSFASLLMRKRWP